LLPQKSGCQGAKHGAARRLSRAHGHGDFIAYGIGRIIENQWPGASLPAFLAMYFIFLWVAWIIAVKLTAPRRQPA